MVLCGISLEKLLKTALLIKVEVEAILEGESFTWMDFDSFESNFSEIDGFIAMGADRVVYELDWNYIVKIGAYSDGIDANKRESEKWEHCTELGCSDRLAEIVYISADYKILIMERLHFSSYTSDVSEAEDWLVDNHLKINDIHSFNIMRTDEEYWKIIDYASSVVDGKLV